MADRPIDFGGLAAALLDRAHILVPQWLPGGTLRGHEYVCGDLSGGEGESCSVNLNSGAWADFAGDEKGRDLISLYAAIRGLGQAAAARELRDELGWQRRAQGAKGAAGAARRPETAEETTHGAAEAAADARPDQGGGDDASREGGPAAPGAHATRWKPIVPVPPHAPADPRLRWGYKDKHTGEWVDLGPPAMAWEYVFEGERYGWVARWDRTDSKGEVQKETIPFTWCEDQRDGRRTQKWHPKTWPAPRPLYVPAGLLSADLSLPVVVVEGEKCAHLGHRLMGHEFDFVSWPGGTKSWSFARWGWVMGRQVILWPDADAKRARLSAAEREAGLDAAAKPLLPLAKQPGMAAMVGIGELLVAQQACTVRMVAMPEPGVRTDGWDLADAVADGWDVERLRAHLLAARAFVPPTDAVRSAAGASTPRMAPAGGGGQGGEVDADAWKVYLVTSAQGAVRPVRENVVLALDGRPDRGVPGLAECEGLIRFNEFSNNVEKTRPTPWGTPAGDWLEADELQMGDWLVRHVGMPSMSRQTLEEAVLIVARRHACHPVRERFLALRGRWDGHDRLDIWLRRCLLVDDEFDDEDPLQQYLRRAGRWFLMAMVARVLPEKRVGTRVVVGPGVKFDYMLVLEGPQGWGKSTVASTLGGDWFADTGLNIGDKDSLMNIQGVLVYEWGELENMNRQEVSKVKLFISSPADRFRATFDRRPAKYPRQVVFIGTTNESHYLTDTTGNRRFWPVRVTLPPDIDWLQENLEQLLAEAVHRVDAGERFYPTRDEQRELFDPQQEARTVQSSLEEGIRQYLYDEEQKVPLGQANGALLNEIGMAQLLERVGYTIDKQTDPIKKKAGAVMHMLGWEVRRTSHPGRPRVYVRPKDDAAAKPRGSPSNARPAQGDQPQEPDGDCPF